VLRRDLDHALLLAASAAGARVEEEALVRGPASTGGAIDGLFVRSGSGATHRVHARVVIAADGRQSRVARSLRLAWHPRAPRRWAVGAYFHDVSGLTSCGEMHIRGAEYIGVAPLPGGLTNACVVTAARAALRDPRALLEATLRAEPALRERFADARLADRPVVLGPLAVESAMVGVPGLLLAGDAAGFIDPMTGDGLHFAVRGAELAALEALRALEEGPLDAHRHLQAARRREFGAKWRFNRALRALAGSPSALNVAGALAGWVPAGVERAILYAGDVRVPLPA
jgi:flavin-dependent dehydrogenase